MVLNQYSDSAAWTIIIRQNLGRFLSIRFALETGQHIHGVNKSSNGREEGLGMAVTEGETKEHYLPALDGEQRG